MKNLSTAILTKFSGSVLETTIGGRMFKGRAPERSEYPYIVFMIVSNFPEKTFTEDFENVTLQFSLFSSTSSANEVEDMYSFLQSLYDECEMDIEFSTLVWMKRENASLMVEDHTVKNGTVQVWHYAVDYDVKLQSEFSGVNLLVTAAGDYVVTAAGDYISV